MSVLKYKNGNVNITFDTINGTKIMASADDEFNFEFPTNIDIKITNKCPMGCKFCFERSTPDGVHSDLNVPFFDSLHAGTEVSLGGGMVTSHPDLEKLLIKLKNQGVFANITVHQDELLKNQQQIEYWLRQGLVHGIGVSLQRYNQDVVDFAATHPTVVIHLINGLTTWLIPFLKGKGLKILILGYKSFGRGLDYVQDYDRALYITGETQCVCDWLAGDLYRYFEAISFDNLAIQQLKFWDIIPKELFDIVYCGDDGTQTMYIDLVEKQYAINSTTPKEERKPLLADIKDMFADIKNNK